MLARKSLTSEGLRSILRDCASAAGIHSGGMAGYGVGLPAPKGTLYIIYIIFVHFGLSVDALFCCEP